MPRRSWDVDLGGKLRRVDVDYKSLTGFMSIEIDGQRAARAWREWQTVAGGATVRATFSGRVLEARVTQSFGAQDHRFALLLDGQVLPGSDELHAPSEVGRSIARGILLIAYTVGAFTFVRQGLPLVAAIAVAAGLLSIAIVERRGWSRRVHVAAVIAVTVGWIALVILGAAFVRTLGQ
jgi:hypothetical protein